MPSVEQVFQKNKENAQETLVGYFPAGFPSVSESIEACVAMCENGVDVLEIGVPYSDPVMDGPVIQQATQMAIENGFRLSQIFEVVRGVTSRVQTPILVMSYWNPVLSYGVSKFASALADSGAKGLITPDLIVDEADEWLLASNDLNLNRVFLATPSSTQERVENIVNNSSGFVYAVSTMGITGTREDLDNNAKSVVAKVRASSVERFTAVGIGISTRSQVLEVNKYADGAIVGSAFVSAYQTGGIESLIATVRDLSGQH
jgi:tryptophan synthase alpha chain